MPDWYLQANPENAKRCRRCWKSAPQAGDWIRKRFAPKYHRRDGARTLCGIPIYPRDAIERELPRPVKYDSRIAFGLAFFKSEADATRYAEHVRQRGATYNGGYFHGMPCGRETQFDYVDATLGQLYAVSE